MFLLKTIVMNVLKCSKSVAILRIMKFFLEVVEPLEHF